MKTQRILDSCRNRSSRENRFRHTGFLVLTKFGTDESHLLIGPRRAILSLACLLDFLPCWDCCFVCVRACTRACVCMCVHVLTTVHMSVQIRSQTRERAHPFSLMHTRMWVCQPKSYHLTCVSDQIMNISLSFPISLSPLISPPSPIALCFHDPINLSLCSWILLGPDRPSAECVSLALQFV